MYVVDSMDPPLFGRDGLRALKLELPSIKRCYYASTETLTLESVKGKYPDVFKDELGILKGIQAQIKVHPMLIQSSARHDQYPTPLNRKSRKNSIGLLKRVF
ncbi:hypothetical protein DPMN_092509 [Dreissena polymorpha]|uniref:Uncharacterized protein n=1 Tax=Dreissena polymorpha TaxID=45954 RepID=A0A9D4L1N9_DREPO|nr:hypothetical protein DPMN_092509 [Dreissena polymorpha]